MRQFVDDTVSAAPARPLAVHSLGVLVAGRLRAARKQAGLTLQDVAKSCRTTAQTIQRLETANMTMSIEWIERIAAALAIEPHMLFADLESPPQVFERRLKKMREEAEVLRVRATSFIDSLDEFINADEASS